MAGYMGQPASKATAPELTPAEEYEFRSEQARKLRPKLVSLGLDVDQVEVAVSRARERMRVRSGILGPQLRVADRYGSMTFDNLDDLAKTVTQELKSEGFGPDPERSVISRLVAAGIPVQEAENRAAYRAHRDSGGRIVVRLTSGGELRGDDAEDERPLVVLARELLAKDAQALPPAVREAARRSVEQTANYTL